jgi:alpha-beta hydrolase superfamily lysophospholipase/8-oxo-dGTP pyrophosphatase MutT (NUDIX family)
MRKEFIIKNNKDQKISAVLYSKNGKIENKQTLIMCHGFTGGKEELWYSEFFSQLVKNNYQVISFDMNGHGKSYGRFIDFTITKAVDDFETVYRYLEKRGVKRIGIMGHSIGGAVCLLVANIRQIQSVILLSPVSRAGFYNRFLTPKKSDRDFLANFWFYPRHSYKRGKYYPVGLNFFKDFEKQPLEQEPRAIKKPILIIHAGTDKAVPLEDSQSLFKTFDFDITALKIIKGADHNFSHSRDIQSVIKLSLDWLDKYLKKHVDPVINLYIRDKKGSILIIKRSQKVGTHKGLWHGIGGYVSPGEPAVKTARREAEEELGINSRYLRLIKKADPYKFYEKEYDKDWKVTPILMESAAKKIKLNWEADKYLWVWPNRLTNYIKIPMAKTGLKILGLI